MAEAHDVVGRARSRWLQISRMSPDPLPPGLRALINSAARALEESERLRQAMQEALAEGSWGRLAEEWGDP